MARYHLVTTLHVPAPREQVWEALADPTGWPSWWRWLRRVDVLDEGAADGTGARHRYSFRTALPYTLTFETRSVRVVRPALVEACAMGDLTGVGLWELTDADGGSRARHTWIVESTKRWMNALAPVARPLFSWNHDVLMRDFAAGLSRRLAAGPVSVEHRAVRPGTAGFGQLPGQTSV